jgi:transcriptional regulator with XRE-family HTH domain
MRVGNSECGGDTVMVRDAAKYILKKQPSPTDVHVGARVRMRRLMLHMSQTQLAEALGISFQQVQKYEHGKNRVGASRLQAIAAILQVPVSFFFDGTSDEAVRDTPSEASSLDHLFGLFSTRDGLDLARAFNTIKSRELKRRLVGLVEALADTH